MDTSKDIDLLKLYKGEFPKSFNVRELINMTIIEKLVGYQSKSFIKASDDIKEFNAITIKIE